jgi:hypothetical protein
MRCRPGTFWTTSAPMNAEAMLADVRARANRLRSPGENLRHYLLIVTPWEVKYLDAVAPTAERRALIFERHLPDFIARYRAKCVFYVASAWVIDVPAGDPSMTATRNEDGDLCAALADRPSISDDPRRRGAIIATEVTAAGQRGWEAPFVRTANAPPLLGEFKALEECSNRLLVPARRALRAVCAR